MRRLILAVVVVLGACEGPTYPDPPVLPDPPPLVPRALNVVVSPAELAIGGGEAVLLLEVTTGAFGAGVKDVPIALAVTEGTLERREAVTDSTGHAKVGWSGSRSAIVTATSGALTTQTTIRVREPQPPPTNPPPPSRPPQPPTTPLPPLPPVPSPIETPDANLVLTVTTNPTDVVVNQPVTLNAALSTLDGSTAPTIAYVVWDFDASQPGADVTAMAPSHTFTSAGLQPVQATAVTTGSRSTTAAVMIDVLPVAPTPLIVVLSTQDGDPAAPGNQWPEDSPVMFTATVSGLASGEAVSFFQWDFDVTASTVDATTSGSVNTASHTYATNGHYTARVTVTTDTGRTASGTVSIIVTSVP